jgi:hypothetical protein
MAASLIERLFAALDSRDVDERPAAHRRERLIPPL